MPNVLSEMQCSHQDNKEIHKNVTRIKDNCKGIGQEFRRHEPFNCVEDQVKRE